MKKVSFLLFIAALGIMSCTDLSDLRNKIAALEQLAQTTPNDENLTPVLQAYNNYVKDHSGDKEWCAIYLYRGAQIYYRAANYGQGISMLERIEKDYPNTEIAPNALLLLGEMYSLYPEKSADAEKCFKNFLDKYPNHPQRTEAEIFFKPENEKLKVQIQRLNQFFYSNPGKKDIIKAERLTRLCREFANKFPDDEFSDDYAFRAGEMLAAMGKHDQAAQEWEIVLSKYPASSIRAKTLLVLAFTYDDKLKQYDKAREKYQQFLREFPKHPQYEQAKLSLGMVGKSADDIVDGFIKKQEGNTKK